MVRWPPRSNPLKHPSTSTPSFTINVNKLGARMLLVPIGFSPSLLLLLIPIFILLFHFCLRPLSCSVLLKNFFYSRVLVFCYAQHSHPSLKTINFMVHMGDARGPVLWILKNISWKSEQTDKRYI